MECLADDLPLPSNPAEDDVVGELESSTYEHLNLPDADLPGNVEDRSLEPRQFLDCSWIRPVIGIQADLFPLRIAELPGLAVEFRNQHAEALMEASAERWRELGHIHLADVSLIEDSEYPVSVVCVHSSSRRWDLPPDRLSNASSGLEFSEVR